MLFRSISIPDNQNLTIKFFAIDEAGNIESVKTEVYNSEIAKNNYIVTNTFVNCPYIRGMLEIKWDDMYPIFTKINKIYFITTLKLTIKILCPQGCLFIPFL